MRSKQYIYNNYVKVVEENTLKKNLLAKVAIRAITTSSYEVYHEANRLEDRAREKIMREIFYYDGFIAGTHVNMRF